MKKNVLPKSCTPTNAMDSKFFYAVRDGKIWFKLIAVHRNASWKLHIIKSRVRWTEKWFNMDGVSSIVNLLKIVEVL